MSVAAFTVKLYLQTQKFEFHMIFICHKAFFPFLYSNIKKCFVLKEKKHTAISQVFFKIMLQPEFGLGAIACHLVFLIGSFILLHIKSDRVYSYVILP